MLAHAILTITEPNAKPLKTDALTHLPIDMKSEKNRRNQRK